MHDHSTAREHPLFTPFSESIVESLEAIARSLMAEKSFSDLRSYFTLLRTYLRSRHVSFPGTPLHGMQVLGGLETRSLQFARVYVLDADEGSFPEAFRESTLLPFPVRRALGLSTSRDQDDIAAYHFELLCAGGPGASPVHRGPGRPAAVAVRGAPAVGRAEEAGHAEERGFVRTISYRVSLTNPAPLPVAEDPRGGLLARHDQPLGDVAGRVPAVPAEVLLPTVLRLARKEELSAEIESMEIGTLVHAVLASATSSGAPGRSRPADLDPEALSRGASTALFAARFGSADSGANRLLRDQVNRHLRDFLAEYLAPARGLPPRRDPGLEHEAAAQWKGFRFGGAWTWWRSVTGSRS